MMSCLSKLLLIGVMCCPISQDLIAIAGEGREQVFSYCLCNLFLDCSDFACVTDFSASEMKPATNLFVKLFSSVLLATLN